MPDTNHGLTADAEHLALAGVTEGNYKRAMVAAGGRVKERFPQVTFEALYADTVMPKRATENSAGYDVCAHLCGRTVRIVRHFNFRGEEKRDEKLADSVMLASGERALIPLGFKASFPAGAVAQIHVRSSSAFNKGLSLANGVGIIDADYPGEWLALVVNQGVGSLTINHGERIAQILFIKTETVDFVAGTVGVTTDRVGGVGSTGT